MRYSKSSLLFTISTCLLFAASLQGQTPKNDTLPGDRMLDTYFKQETARLRDACLADVATLEQWQAKRKRYREQLLEMLGLAPMPAKTPLKSTTTGTIEHAEFTVEKVHFQSRPGLYVTGNVYVPRGLTKKAPAILYVCGHGGVKKNGVSFGNKVHYHHHGSWFARHGFVCLTIDSLQLGEIEGIHHGTYRHDMWWWSGRGYSPAGVEAWNCIRALDYLQSRPDVDGTKLGVTGRSGGGAYSWWIAAIDERIKAAVPVAGITDLQNHVVDGCVEGHCDCMYIVNTYQWDYPMIAALVAPRPLLISNTDRDGIFPLDGVVRTYQKVRRIYELYGAADKVGLHITSGPHKDTQELRVHAFRWLNRHLKNEEQLLEKPAIPFFEAEQLKVFAKLPSDQKNSRIHDSFVAQAATPSIPTSPEAWAEMRDGWRANLRDHAFRAWPAAELNAAPRKMSDVTRNGLRLRSYEFESQSSIDLPLLILERANVQERKLVVLNVLDQHSWQDLMAMLRVDFADQLTPHELPAAEPEQYKQTRQMLQSFPWTMAYVAPRGIGRTMWNQSKRKQTQIRRRFLLLGQTLDGMRVWDTRRAMQALRNVQDFRSTDLWLQSRRRMAGVTLFASLYEPNIKRVDLYELPGSLRDGPFVLNAQRFLDTNQLLAMAAERSRIVLYDRDATRWQFAAKLAQEQKWPENRLQIRPPPGGEESTDPAR